MSGNVEAAITRVARRTGVNRAALDRLVWNESRGNPRVGMDKSNYSAGIAQVSRNIWKQYSGLPYSYASNPKYFELNLEVGAKYLKLNYDHYHSWKIALEAYNEGETVMNQVLAGKRQLSPITVRYVQSFEDK